MALKFELRDSLLLKDLDCKAAVGNKTFKSYWALVTSTAVYKPFDNSRQTPNAFSTPVGWKILFLRLW